MKKKFSKYYIDHEKKERECGNCFKVLSFDLFYKTKYGNPQSYCKKCSFQIQRTRMFEKKLERHPDIFVECDVCDKIYRKEGTHKCLE